MVESQGQDAEIVSIRDWVQSGAGDEGWAIHTDGSLRYRGRVVVPQLTNLREEILKEFHCCNAPKYTLTVFDIFRVFCKHNLNVS